MAYTFKHGDRPLEGITVQRAVGRGGFGEVYYALTDSGKQIALKYLRENPEIELRGVAHVMNLKSPHLITIYDVKRNAEGEPFVIMEYVSGPSLRELMLADAHGMGTQKAAFFLDGVAKGLAYLHDRGIVHRDLKPANIFYDDGYVKIGDYGLSKHISVSKHSGQTVSVGTVHYMAPEIGSGSYTKAIDIYALGVILFELLTGRLPFTGSSMGEVLMRHLSERPDLSGIPEPFAGVIAKALAKDPKDRYQDVNEMLDVLRQHGDISASISSFDPATLTRAPRDPSAVDPEQTLTTPPPAPPSLDVRQAAIRQGVPERVADRLQRKVDRIAQKLEKGADRLRRGAERIGGVQMAGNAEAAPPRTASRGQFFVLLAVAVGVAIALSSFHGGRDLQRQGVALVLCILAGTFGPLLAYFRFLLHSPTRSSLSDKLSYVAVTGVLMIPAFAIARDVGSPLAQMMLAPLIMLVLCDWTKRIEAGRRGLVSGGQAFWPAIVGMIVAGFVHAESYQWVAAGICATMSLLGQAGAALWPPTRAGAPLPVGRGVPAAPRGPVNNRIAASSSGVAAAGQPGAAAGLGALLATTPREPRSPFARSSFTFLSVLAAAVSVSSFFALVIGQPKGEGGAFLLFFALAGTAWLPFLTCKATQQYKLPPWRGTLRMLSFSAALCFAAGMITALAFGGLHEDDQTAAVFFLVFSLVTALIVLCLPGCSRLVARSTLAGQVAPESGATAPAPVPPPDAHQHESPAATSPVAATVTESSPPLIIDAAEPSFVGRATDAGLSFFGKLLLLAAIVLGAGHQGLRDQIDSALRRNDVRVSPQVGHLLVAGVPGPALLGVAVLGCAFLLLARRRGGGAHLVRGCAGCVAGLWGLVMALGPSASALEKLFTTTDWSSLPWAEIAGPLAGTAIPLAASFLLLSWPKRRENTIVI